MDRPTQVRNGFVAWSIVCTLLIIFLLGLVAFAVKQSDATRAHGSELRYQLGLAR